MDMDNERHKIFLQQVGETVKKFGRQIIGTYESNENGRAFTYTIGNSLQGVPELIMMNITGPEAADLLNLVSDQLRDEKIEVVDGLKFTPKCVLDSPTLSNDLYIRFEACEPGVREELTIQAGQFLANETYPVFHLILSDENGVDPQDEDCNEQYVRQLPLLSNQPALLH